MMKLTEPDISSHFMRLNRVVFEAAHSLIHFPFAMQVKTAGSETNATSQVALIDDALKTITITAFADHSSEWNTYSDTSGKILGSSESADFPFHVKNHNWQEDSCQYVTQRNHLLYLGWKNKFQSSPLSLQSNPSSTNLAILNKIPESDPDVSTYVNELLRNIKPRRHQWVKKKITRAIYLDWNAAHTSWKANSRKYSGL